MDVVVTDGREEEARDPEEIPASYAKGCSSFSVVSLLAVRCTP